MSEIKDLDMLIDDRSPAFRFTGSADGRDYQFRMFIPSAVSLLDVKARQDGLSDAERQEIVVTAFLSAQFAHMTREWIAQNLSLVKQNYIFSMILKELNRVNDFLLDEAEEAKKRMKRAEELTAER